MPAADIRSLFPACVEVEVADARDEVEDLFPAERAAISRAIPKRRREYAAVRNCARRAMARLGVEPAPLLNERDRSPRWPTGIVGSIAHTGHHVAAVVASSAALRSVGVDLEPDEGVGSRLWSRICRPEERSYIDAQPEAERGRLVRRIFSAKECFYKAQYPLSRQYLGFQDVGLELDLGRERFVAELRREAGPDLHPGDRFEGRFAVTSGLICAAMVFEHR